MNNKLIEEEAVKYVNKKHKPASGQMDKSIQNFYDCKHSFIAGIEWYKEYLKTKNENISNTSERRDN
jgi:hypothetical protein